MNSELRNKATKALCVLCLLFCVPSGRAQSSNKVFTLGTNNVLRPGETNFFAVNSNLLNQAISSGGGGGASLPITGYLSLNSTTSGDVNTNPIVQGSIEGKSGSSIIWDIDNTGDADFTGSLVSGSAAQFSVNIAGYVTAPGFNGTPSMNGANITNIPAALAPILWTNFSAFVTNGSSSGDASVANLCWVNAGTNLITRQDGGAWGSSNLNMDMLVRQAGPGNNTDLMTRVTNVIDSTHLQTADLMVTSVTNVPVFFGTEEGYAFSNCLQLLTAPPFHWKVLFTGWYMTTNPLQHTTGNYYSNDFAQFILPLVSNITSGNNSALVFSPSLTLVGAGGVSADLFNGAGGSNYTTLNGAAGIINGYVATTNSRFLSCMNTNNGFAFIDQGYAVPFNYVSFSLENFNLVMPVNSPEGAWDLSCSQSTRSADSQVTTGQGLAAGIVNTNPSSFGFKLPAVNCAGKSDLVNCSVLGAYSGIELSEHSQVYDFYSQNNYTGIISSNGTLHGALVQGGEFQENHWVCMNYTVGNIDFKGCNVEDLVATANQPMVAFITNAADVWLSGSSEFSYTGNEVVPTNINTPNMGGYRASVINNQQASSYYFPYADFGYGVTFESNSTYNFFGSGKSSMQQYGTDLYTVVPYQNGNGGYLISVNGGTNIPFAIYNGNIQLTTPSVYIRGGGNLDMTLGGGEIIANSAFGFLDNGQLTVNSNASFGSNVMVTGTNTAGYLVGNGAGLTNAAGNGYVDKTITNALSAIVTLAGTTITNWANATFSTLTELATQGTTISNVFATLSGVALQGTAITNWANATFALIGSGGSSTTNFQGIRATNSADIGNLLVETNAFISNNLTVVNGTITGNGSGITNAMNVSNAMAGFYSATNWYGTNAYEYWATNTLPASTASNWVFFTNFSATPSSYRLWADCTAGCRTNAFSGSASSAYSVTYDILYTNSVVNGVGTPFANAVSAQFKGTANNASTQITSSSPGAVGGSLFFVQSSSTTNTLSVVVHCIVRTP